MLTEFLAELSEFSAEINEFSLPKHYCFEYSIRLLLSGSGG